MEDEAGFQKKIEESEARREVVPMPEGTYSNFLLFVSRNTLSCLIIFLKSKELVCASNRRRVIRGDYIK